MERSFCARSLTEDRRLNLPLLGMLTGVSDDSGLNALDGAAEVEWPIRFSGLSRWLSSFIILPSSAAACSR